MKAHNAGAPRSRLVHSAEYCEIPVVKVKEIELEVLLGLLVNQVSVDYRRCSGVVTKRQHAARLQRIRGGVSEAMPALTLSDDRHQSQPL